MSETFGKYNERNVYSMADSPRNKEESADYANALSSSGHYPVGLGGCFTVGISGGCGKECWVYLEGNCGEPDEFIGHFDNAEEKEQHERLYGEIEG